ncbi:MAG TPA: amidohydrolase family protein [Terriglobales bacterium]|nr:amidohydrolase family protein [Terriglobales bacterium]
MSQVGSSLKGALMIAEIKNRETREIRMRKVGRCLVWIFSFIAVVAFLVISGRAQSSASDEAVVLKDVRVIDGLGGPPLEQSVILIKGDRIVAIGTIEKVSWPKSARVIDYGGKTVVPGLISDHSHVGQVDGAGTAPQNYNRANILRQLQQYEVYGVTTVVALGLNGDLFYELRPQLHAGALPGADLLGADRGIGIPNGAPPIFNLPESRLYRVSTPEEAMKAVDEMVARKPDLIKIWIDDFRGSLRVKMPPEVYAAAIKEAHKLGLRVAAHIYYLADAKSLVNSGVDIIAHGVRDRPVDAEFVSLMKSHSAWYISTIDLDESFYIYAEKPEWLKNQFLLHALQPALLAQFNDPDWRAKTLGNQKQIEDSKASVLMNERNLKALYDAGVNIGFGTDSGANALRIPGFAEHRELELMVDAGLTPLEAISLATAKAAALLHLDDRGVLAPGKLADMIVVDGNPAAQIKGIHNIEAVWHRGKLVGGRVQDFTP